MMQTLRVRVSSTSRVHNNNTVLCVWTTASGGGERPLPVRIPISIMELGSPLLPAFTASEIRLSAKMLMVEMRMAVSPESSSL